MTEFHLAASVLGIRSCKVGGANVGSTCTRRKTPIYFSLLGDLLLEHFHALKLSQLNRWYKR